MKDASLIQHDADVARKKGDVAALARGIDGKGGSQGRKLQIGISGDFFSALHQRYLDQR